MELYEHIYDLSKGYTLYQMITMMSLPKTVSMSMYGLVCAFRKKKKFYISNEEITRITGTAYARPNDIKTRILEVAQRHLKESETSDMLFTFKPVEDKESTSKKKPIKGWDIYPHHTHKSINVKSELLQVSRSYSVPKQARLFFQELGVKLQGKNQMLGTVFCESLINDKAQIMNTLNYFVKSAKKKGLEGDEVAKYVVVCMSNHIKKVEKGSGIKKDVWGSQEPNNFKAIDVSEKKAPTEQELKDAEEIRTKLNGQTSLLDQINES